MDLAMKPRSIKQNKTLNSGESMSNPRFEDVDMLSFRPTRGKWWVIMSFHLPSDKDSEPFIGNTSPVLIWSLHIFALWFISCLCFVHCFISWSLTSSGFFQQYNGFPVLGQTTFWIWTCAIGDLAPSYISYMSKQMCILVYQSHPIPSAYHDQSAKLGLRPYSHLLINFNQLYSPTQGFWWVLSTLSSAPWGVSCDDLSTYWSLETARSTKPDMETDIELMQSLSVYLYRTPQKSASHHIPKLWNQTNAGVTCPQGTGLGYPSTVTSPLGFLL